MKSQRNKGKFAGIPVRVVEHEDYRNLSGNAVKLLVAMAYQYNGRNNNGDLTAAWSYMKENHGFRSPATLSRALHELLRAEMLIKTRESLFQKTNNKCALFALPWYPIDECKGKLDVASTTVPPRLFSKPLKAGGGK